MGHTSISFDNLEQEIARKREIRQLERERDRETNREVVEETDLQ